MLNGRQRSLEKQLPESDRHWPQPSVRGAAMTMAPPFLVFLNPEPLCPEL